MPKNRAFPSAVFLLAYGKLVLFWNHDPHKQVHEYARYTAWDECDDEPQPEPEGANTKKLGKPTANSGDHAITP